MKAAGSKARLRARIYAALGSVLIVLTLMYVIGAAWESANGRTLSSSLLLTAIGLPITMIYSLNHCSAHILWACDNWKRESRVNRPRLAKLTGRQWRCLFFLFCDVPLLWLTIAAVWLSLRSLLRHQTENQALLLHEALLNALYTYNGAACHVSWAFDNWRQELAREKQRRSAAGRWWAWTDWSFRQKYGVVLFLFPDILLLLPLTVLFLSLAAAGNSSGCGACAASAALTVLYSFHNVYGHYCAVRYAGEPTRPADN